MLRGPSGGAHPRRAGLLVLGVACVAGGCRASRATGEHVERVAAAPRAIFPGVSLYEDERVDGAGHRTVFTFVRADLALVRPVVRRPPHGRLEALASDAAVRVAVNAGFFEPDESPSGWLVSQGETLASPRARGGTGWLVVRADRGQMVPSTGDVAPADADFAVQCGPRLIEPDGSLGMHGDDGKRAARTALCLRREGRELDVVLAWTRNGDRDGPTLFQLATWLARPLSPADGSGCEAALNLDGGPSTGLYLRDDPSGSHRPLGRVPFAIVLAERGSEAGANRTVR